MNTLIDFAFSHKRTMILTLLLILLAGAVTYVAVPKESSPDIDIPIIYVTIPYEGISPEDAERLLIRPMEQQLRSIEGLKEVRSTGYEGGASVVMEFEAGFDADEAMNDVREKVDLAKPDLPDDTDEPTVHEVNISLFPVILVILSGDVPERTLMRFGRDLQDSIEGIASVLKATIVGDRDELVEILIDPAKVDSYGLTFNDTVAVMRNSNLLVAAGSQDTGRGRFAVKVPGLFENVIDIMRVPVKVDGDAVVHLGDIADVRRTFKDPSSFARVDGRPAITLEVSKRTGENIIDTIEAVRKVVAAERAAWPETVRNSVHVAFAQDQSEDIRTMLEDLQNNVLMAILLVMIVILAALGFRSSVLVLIAIPGSFLTGILVLAVADLTLNMVVLFGLILSVGLLVDASVVVTEYADRKMIEGLDRRDAYKLAAKRMAWPITASTATTLAAFLPLVFWPGVVGEFMKFLPITVLAVLSASLAMAMLFVPVIGSIPWPLEALGRAVRVGFGLRRRKAPRIDGDPVRMHALAEGTSVEELMTVGGGTGLYLRTLRLALAVPKTVLFAASAILVGTVYYYANHGHGVEFFPDVEPPTAQVQIRARGNLSIHEQNALVREVEARIPRREEYETVYARTGRESTSQEAEDIIGTISLEFVDWDQRRPAETIFKDIKRQTADLAGVFVDARKKEEGPPVGKPIQMRLSSRDPAKLVPAVEKVLQGFAAVGGLVNIEDERPLPGIDWEFVVDRGQAAKFGVDINVVGNALQMVTTGILLGGYRPDDADEEIDIRARYPVPFRTIEQLSDMRVNTAAGQVPISNFVERKAKPKTGTIKRVDGVRAMTVKADVAEGINVAAKLAEIQKWLAQSNWDPAVSITYQGEDEEQKKAQAFLLKAFVVALFIMAIILVTQFDSLYSAFLILSAVIMSTTGVLLGLIITGQPFGIIMSGVGVIALAGIVVNNNIVLIDTFDRLIKTARSPTEAILLTGGQRLRPVMLTTATTLLGLMPMVLRTNIDFLTREVTVGAPSSQWWAQLASAVVFGMAFASVLTLIVTPSALMLRENLRAWWRRRRERVESLSESGVAE